MGIEKYTGKERLSEEYKRGDLVRIVPRTRIFESWGAGSRLYEITSVSKDAKRNPIIFARVKGTLEKPEEISFYKLEKVTIQ